MAQQTDAPQAPLAFALPGAEAMAQGLLQHWACEGGRLSIHRFPDGEACPSFAAELAGRDVVLVACLDQPDAKLFALYLCARTARELGARSIGLVLPYLPYMRQDTVFAAGEGTSARHVAALLSSCADWLVTVDPHLHRFHSLDQVYTIPAAVVASAAPVAQWIRDHVADPCIIGPDSESEQWVAQVAGLIGCAHLVMQKERSGDRAVQITLPIAPPPGCTPVLLDDIASSGRTLAAAVAQLRAAGTQAPLCIVVHPLFGGDALAVLQGARPAGIVSCNTLVHDSNAIDICQPLAWAAASLLAQVRDRAA